MTPEQIARFWSHVDTSGECWIWTAARHEHGYGQFSAHAPGHRTVRYAHRTAWELTYGAIPKGLGVLHQCDNPPCCNPAHLFLGTQRDNNLDCATKGRHSRGTDRFNAVLTAPIVSELRRRYAQGGTTYRLLALEYGIAAATICSAIHGRSWAYINDPPPLPTQGKQVPA